MRFLTYGSRGKDGGKDSYGVWDGHVHTAVFKWITNKDLLYTQGTLLSVMWQPGGERGLGESGYMYMYG